MAEEQKPTTTRPLMEADLNALGFGDTIICLYYFNGNKTVSDRFLIKRHFGVFSITLLPGRGGRERKGFFHDVSVRDGHLMADGWLFNLSYHLAIPLEHCVIIETQS